jgi:integrase
MAIVSEQRKALGLAVRDPDAYLIPGDLKPFVSAHALCAMVKRLCEEVGIEVEVAPDTYRVLHPHELRHTFATTLINAGRPPQEVAAILGDRVETVLRVYHHLLEGVHGEDAAPVVDGLYGAA